MEMERTEGWKKNRGRIRETKMEVRGKMSARILTKKMYGGKGMWEQIGKCLRITAEKAVKISRKVQLTK